MHRTFHPFTDLQCSHPKMEVRWKRIVSNQRKHARITCAQLYSFSKICKRLKTFNSWKVEIYAWWKVS